MTIILPAPNCLLAEPVGLAPGVEDWAALDEVRFVILVDRPVPVTVPETAVLVGTAVSVADPVLAGTTAMNSQQRVFLLKKGPPCS